MIYTSGSTGRPKGVVVEHRSVNLYLAWARQAYDSVGGRALVHSPISFDLTVTGLYAPLTSGGCAHLLAVDGSAPAAEVAGAARPTFVKATPATCRCCWKWTAASHPPPAGARRGVAHGRGAGRVAAAQPRGHGDQRVRPDRDHRGLHRVPDRTRGTGALRRGHHRPSGLEHPHVRAGRPAAAGPGRRHRRAVHRR
ncbi:amino acid adenylation domain-containing protein [Streptacidiphilus sp. 4-A2]|nr:amino acid adenylation domain-containing protein [Streptacidiphilus sp. 4-A2]